MNDEEVMPEEKACRDSAHALRGGGELGQLCRPCAEDELIRLRSIVARLSKSALRIIKRPDGYWLFVEAGGLEAAIILRGPEINPFSIVDRCIAAAAIAEILPGSMQPRIQSTPEVVAREHIIDGPCWCGPVEEGKVFKHKLETSNG